MAFFLAPRVKGEKLGAFEGNDITCKWCFRKFLMWPTEILGQLTDFIFSTVVEMKKVQILLEK